MRVFVVLVVAALSHSLGCLPVQSYHSAKTMAKGDSAFGLTFSATTYTDPDDGGDSVTIPGIVPEVAYHIGVADNIEVGGRIAPGFLFGEFDAKFRLVRGQGLHIAVAPALGQIAAFVTVTTVRLPVIATYELNDIVSINASAFGNFWILQDADSDSDFAGVFASDDSLVELVGVSGGLEITGRSFFMRPSFEFSRAFERADGSDRVVIGAAVIHFGWKMGETNRQLDEQKKQLDRIEQKLGWKDRRNIHYEQASVR